MLDTITKAVISSKVDAAVGVTVILLGFGGFGKTTLATGLCYQPAIQQYFLDGVLLITLGPKPPDSDLMLIKLYDQLTNKKSQEQGSFSMADKLRWYVSSYLERLLVIIDDVWIAEDALIYANIFSTCKIVLTTRKTDISTHIPAKEVIKIEEMSMDESKLLLTYRVVNTNKLNPSAAKMLEILAQNLHRWPLLLGLVRNHLHSQIKLQSPINQAIQKVQQNLYEKGLTAFDSNVASRISKNNAVKACVDATLELLSQNELSNLKVLVLYAGTGVKIPKSSLHYFWTDNVDENLQSLTACGLVGISRMALPPSICTLACVEMHAVITQYLIDSMDFGTLKQIFDGMHIANMQFFDWSSSPEIQEDMMFGLLGIIDFEALESDEEANGLFSLQFSVGFIDNLCIPFSIQRLVIVTKIVQQGIVEKLGLFSKHFKQHPQFISLLANFEAENNLKTEKAYMRFIRTYKEIKSFLAIDNHTAIMSAIKRYLHNHPVQSLVNNFYKLVQELMQNCKYDDASLSFIMENTGSSMKEAKELHLDESVSGFEHIIKLRIAHIKVIKSSITMEEFLDTITDLWVSLVRQFDANSIGENRDSIIEQLESFDPENDDNKPIFDAITRAYSHILGRQPGLKSSIAELYGIDATLPIQDFVLSIIKRYVQATPITT